MKKTVLKSLMAGLIAMAALTASAQPEGAYVRMYMPDFAIVPGQTTWADVILIDDNTGNGITNLQFWLGPCEGLNFVLTEKVNPDETIDYTLGNILEYSTPRWYNMDVQHIVEWGMVNTGNFAVHLKNDTLRFVYSSMTKTPLWGESGDPLVRVQFKADESFTGGQFVMNNMVLTDYDDNAYYLDGEEVTHVYVATPLANVVSSGEDNNTYAVAEDLAVVAKIPATNSVIVSDGRGNWMRVTTEDEQIYETLSAMTAIKGGTLIGTLSESNQNQVMTIAQAPTATDATVNVTIREWNLAQDNPDSEMYKFAPAVNEVFNLTGYYFGQSGNMRGYSDGTGQSATINMEWCQEGELPANGTRVTMSNCIAQLKAPWDPETSGAPRKVKASDELSFQNYEIYPLAIEPGNIFTGVDNISGSRQVASVKYVNVAGQVSDTPFDGVNMVITRYSDGTQSTSKVIK